ncbi:MAG: hypothetical protein ACXVCY_16425 [Pseudobdellovibrionaceae bacterium]
MEKISGIIPASPRTQVADVSVAQPARPGALALGRPMGKNSLGDRITLSKQAEELRQTGMLPEPEASPVYKNPAETKKLKVIDELNKKFFTNPKAIARESDQTQTEELLGRSEDNESLFYVEKEMRPQSPPLKQMSEVTA